MIGNCFFSYGYSVQYITKTQKIASLFNFISAIERQRKEK